VVSTTRTPSTASMAAVIASHWSWSAASTVMSRSSLSSDTSMRSTAPMIPPAWPIALATWPSMPGRWAISMRIVSEYWADGEMLMGGAYVGVDRSHLRAEFAACVRRRRSHSL
jgi:hypothetical protein